MSASIHDPPSSSSTAPPPKKSPPIAFAPTSNDALVSTSNNYGDTLASPPTSAMGQISPLSPANYERQLQAIINQQNNALRKARESFEEERKAWELERLHLQERIARLEQHIKPGDHWSPAKSPTMSPSSTAAVVSPTSRAHTNSLPTIAEDENFQPLSSRRQNAPSSIDLPQAPAVVDDGSRRKSAVSFTTNDGMLVEEIAVSPPRRDLSPPPVNNRVLAGHTPIRAPARPPTPPPREMSMDGIGDTPTRHNTHINTYLTQSSDEEEDKQLKGPLMMPELPNQPSEANFTLDALSKKLEHIHEHPEHSKPMVFSQPSPGLASPANERESEHSSQSLPRAALDMDTEAPFAPIATRASEFAPSELSSNVLSPSNSNGGVISPQEAHEAKVQAEFEQGGIKLKKKTSVNFGAPFGSLKFAGARRPSQEPS